MALGGTKRQIYVTIEMKKEKNDRSVPDWLGKSSPNLGYIYYMSPVIWQKDVVTSNEISNYMI